MLNKLFGNRDTRIDVLVFVPCIGPLRYIKSVYPGSCRGKNHTTLVFSKATRDWIMVNVITAQNPQFFLNISQDAIICHIPLEEKIGRRSFGVIYYAFVQLPKMYIVEWIVEKSHAIGFVNPFYFQCMGIRFYRHRSQIIDLTTKLYWITRPNVNGYIRQLQKWFVVKGKLFLICLQVGIRGVKGKICNPEKQPRCNHQYAIYNYVCSAPPLIASQFVREFWTSMGMFWIAVLIISGGIGSLIAGWYNWGRWGRFWLYMGMAVIYFFAGHFFIGLV